MTWRFTRAKRTSRRRGARTTSWVARCSAAPARSPCRRDRRCRAPRRSPEAARERAPAAAPTGCSSRPSCTRSPYPMGWRVVAGSPGAVDARELVVQHRPVPGERRAARVERGLPRVVGVPRPRHRQAPARVDGGRTGRPPPRRRSPSRPATPSAARSRPPRGRAPSGRPASTTTTTGLAVACTAAQRTPVGLEPREGTVAEALRVRLLAHDDHADFRVRHLAHGIGLAGGGDDLGRCAHRGLDALQDRDGRRNLVRRRRAN